MKTSYVKKLGKAGEHFEINVESPLLEKMVGCDLTYSQRKFLEKLFFDFLDREITLYKKELEKDGMTLTKEDAENQIISMFNNWGNPKNDFDNKMNGIIRIQENA